MMALNLPARQVADGQPLDGGGAFLADCLALAAGERVQEIVETGVTVVAPVELYALADQPAAASKCGSWSGVTKVTCAEDSSFWSVTASIAPISAGASAGSRSSSRGPGTGEKGEAIWSLG